MFCRTSLFPFFEINLKSPALRPENPKSATAGGVGALKTLILIGADTLNSERDLGPLPRQHSVLNPEPGLWLHSYVSPRFWEFMSQYPTLSLLPLFTPCLPHPHSHPHPLPHLQLMIFFFGRCTVGPPESDAERGEKGHKKHVRVPRICHPHRHSAVVRCLRHSPHSL